MIKLWAHECTRVFQDRLIDNQDIDQFQALLNQVVKDKFKKDMKKLVTAEPLIFGSFVPLCYPNGDKSLKPYNDVYCEIYDKEKMAKICRNQLEDYNGSGTKSKMNLVLFMSAIEHVVKINRIITTEFGHALLMGVGGSGRKSCTNLAIFIAAYDQFEIEITKGYVFDTWREDMRLKLFNGCGVEAKQTVFLLNDT